MKSTGRQAVAWDTPLEARSVAVEPAGKRVTFDHGIYLEGSGGDEGDLPWGLAIYVDGRGFHLERRETWCEDGQLRRSVMIRMADGEPGGTDGELNLDHDHALLQHLPMMLGTLLEHARQCGWITGALPKPAEEVANV